MKRAPKLTPADQIRHDACREVLTVIRFSIDVGRNVPTDLLAKRLAMAADEAAALEVAS